MGSLCGKPSSSSDNFSTPGRTLNSAAPPASDPNGRIPIPNRATKPTYTSTPGRTVGGPPETGSARGAAARAAEERAQQKTASAGGGKLNAQLLAQKKMSDRDALDQASRAERGAREADAIRESRNYN